MRLLITNNTLAARAGSELYLRDVCLALQSRGHTISAFSLRLGEVAAELRAAGITVVDDLHALPEPPELIHGQHHVETCLASLHFPQVPVVYFCHGVIPWEETPPRLPTIRRYVAVDDAVYEHLTATHHLPASQITRIYNFADLARFSRRAPLPERPMRALAFTNYAATVEISPLQEACVRAGLQLDLVGQANGNPSAHPEQLLPAYDLVFAKARAAIEAMAVGCAVILCETRTAGPLVTRENVATLRPWNFGFRVITQPFSVSWFESQIAQYRAEDAHAVTDWMRAHASMTAAIDQIEALHAEVLAESAQSPAVSERALLAATADYLRLPAERLKELTFGKTTLSSAPATPPPVGVIQLFADPGTGYAEAASMIQPLPREEFQTIRFENLETLQPHPERPLRLDPINVPALLQITRLRLYHPVDYTTFYLADASTHFAGLTLHHGVLGRVIDDQFWLLATNDDPQLLLPPLPLPAPPACSLEITLKVQTTEPELLRAFAHLLAAPTAITSAPPRV